MIKMEDSGQKLMRIDFDSEDGPSSPVFHKKKWVVLPKSLKRSLSIPSLNLSTKQEFKNFTDVSKKRTKMFDAVDLAQAETSPYNEINADNDRDNKDDALLIYNTTPTKQYKHKKKSIDLLSCSFKNEDGYSKKSKINDSSFGSSLASSSIKNSSLLSLKGGKYSHSIIRRIDTEAQRKLLYANNEVSIINSKVQKVTVDDVYKSVIMIDEADLHSSPKEIRQISLKSESNDFKTVTSLNNEVLQNDIDVNDQPVSNSNADDSFSNFMFTEIENECSNAKLGSLKSDVILERVIDNPSSSEDNNLMNDSLGNCGFTEIEENYSYSKHSKDKSALLSPCKLLATSHSCTSVIPKSGSSMQRSSVENYKSNDSIISVCKSSCNEKSECKDESLFLPESKCDSIEKLNNQLPCKAVDEIKSDLLGGNETVVSAVKISEVTKICLPMVQDVNTSPDSFSVMCCPEIESSNVCKLQVSFSEDKLQHISTDSNKESDLFDSTILASKFPKEMETVKDEEHYFSNSKESFIDLDSISTGDFKHTHLNEVNYNQHLIMKNKTLDHSFQDDPTEQDFLNSSSKSFLSLNETLTGRMRQFLSKKICSPSNKNEKHQQIDISFSKDFTKSDETFKETNDYKNSKTHNNCSRSQSPLLQTSANLTTVLPIPGKTADSSEEYLEKLKSNNDNDNTALYYEQYFDDIISAEVKSRSPVNDCEMSGETQVSLILEQSLCTEVVLPNESTDTSSVEGIKTFRYSDCDENIFNEVKSNCSEKSFSSVLPQCHKITFMNTKMSEELCDKPVEESICSNVEPNKCDYIVSNGPNDKREYDKASKMSGCSNGNKFSFNQKDVLISQDSLKQFNSSFENTIEDSCNSNQINDNSSRNGWKPSSLDKTLGQKGFHNMDTLNEFMFLTAGGKNINVSKDCLKIVKSRFKDTLEDSSIEINNKKDENNENVKDNTERTSTMGMMEKNLPKVLCDNNLKNSTFSENDFSISQNCMQQFNSSFKSSQPISSYNQSPEDHLEKSLLDKGFQDSNTTSFMFLTAGGKNINVLEDCLKKIKSKYKDILEDSGDQTNVNNSFLIKDEIKTSDVDKPDILLPYENVSKETNKFSLINTKELGVLETTTTHFNNDYGKKILTSNQGNDQLNTDICEEQNVNLALDDVANRNGNIVDNTSPVCFNSSTSPISCKKTSNNFAFSTALGKNVGVSEKSLKKVKSNSTTSGFHSDHSTLENINSPQPSMTPIVERVNVSFQDLKAEFNNFSFNSKNNLNSEHEPIPETSSAKNNTFFSVNDNSIENCHFLKNSCKSVSFSTASGRNISVSDDILANMKSKFSDIFDVDNHLIEDSLRTKQKTNNTEIGLLSYTEKIRSVKALNKEQLPFSKKLTNTCSLLNKNDLLPGDLTCLKEKPNILESFSFSSASDNIKEISSIGEKSNETIRKCNLDSESSDKISNMSSNINVIRGFKFSTAGGKSIHISESALAKVKSKFSDTLEFLENCDDFEKISLPGMAGKTANVSKEAVGETKSEFSRLSKSQKKDEDQFEKALESKSVDDLLMASISKFIDTNISGDALVKVKSEFGEFLEQTPPLLLEDVLTDELRQKSPKKSKPSDYLLSDNLNSKKDLSRTGAFMFSSASGKNVLVSEDALSKVKSKFSDTLELTKTCGDLEKSSLNAGLPGGCTLKDDVVSESKAAVTQTNSEFSGLFKNPHKDRYRFETALQGKNVGDTSIVSTSRCVDTNNKSVDTLVKVQSEFGGFLEQSPPLLLKDALIDKLKEKSFGCLLSENLKSKEGLSCTGGFIFSSASGKNVIVSEDALSKVKSKSNDVFQPPFSLTDDMPPKMTKDDKSFKKPIQAKQPAQLFDGFMFSTAGGKDISVSEDALAKVKSIFNDEFEKAPSHLETTDQTNKYNENSQNLKNFEMTEDSSYTDTCKNVEDSVEVVGKSKRKFNEIFHNAMSDINPGEQTLEKNNLCKEVSNLKENIKLIEDIGGPSNKKKCDDLDNIMLKNDDPKCTFPESGYSKAVEQRPVNCLHSKIFFENLEQIGKKSKSPHSENSNLEEPIKKKICFHSERTDFPIIKLGNEFKNDEPKESFQDQFPFTQSISQSLLNEEVDTIEKNITINDLNVNKRNEFQRDINQSIENKELPQIENENLFNTQESDISMICEISDSTAAFIADCTPDKSILSSPSSFFNRRKMKPINLLNIEFDEVDDELMVRAESTITSTHRENTSVNCFSKEHVLVSKNLRSSSAEILTIRNAQRTQADKIIRDKLANPPSVSPGLYMSLRNQGKHTSITDSPLGNPQFNLTKDQLLQQGVMGDVANVTSTNAGEFKFCAEKFFNNDDCFSSNGTVDIGNDFSLILSDDNKIGLEEISRSFLASPKVDPSLVTSCWVKNHFRWIVWKLASYEKVFPKLLSGRLLTPENVLHQLKYRYDREIDLAQRSALKRILECDEPSSRRLIICVADVQKVDLDNGESSFEIELTDGWYSVWTKVDSAMINLIKRGKVRIGTKLVSQSVELLNCAEGCDPLELTDTVRLKLHTNCTRRVKWNTKMGFTKCPGPIYVSLNSIFHNGGIIGLTSAIVIRVYPLLFMSKDADGKTVIRNTLAENQVANLKQNNFSLKSEELYEKFLPEVEATYKTKCKVKFERNKIIEIKDPELLWRIISNESDPSEIQALMSTDQLLEVQKYHEMISSKIKEEVQKLVKKELKDLMPSQKAKTLLKLRLFDPFAEYSALLTVWNPSEDLCHLLTEKKCFDFYGLNASGIRDKVLQLSSTNRTIYEESKVFKPSQKYERKITYIADISSNAVSPHFGELDVVGIVIFVKEPEKAWGVTNVYLSDAKENFLMITFWTSLKTFGCEDILKPGSVVACINLQWRQGSGSYVVPSTYANELTSFSSNPGQDYLFKELQAIKAYLKSEDIDNFKLQRQRKLFTLLKERELMTRTPPVRSADTPKVSKRIENLKRYGEASPLPNISLTSSPDIYKKFRSPKSDNS